jgi:hypothetical protein
MVKRCILAVVGKVPWTNIALYKKDYIEEQTKEPVQDKEGSQLIS